MPACIHVLLMAAFGAAMVVPVVQAQSRRPQGNATSTVLVSIQVQEPARAHSGRVAPVTAQAHSPVVRRDAWARLDADQDGRISTTEAARDPGFDGLHSAMNADGDGFVTQAEYRAYAKADMP